MHHHDLSYSAQGAAASHGHMARHLSNLTRILHLLLLLAVINQLLSSQFISRPLPGEAPSWLFLSHEYVGMASFALVLAFWLWVMVRRGETRLRSLIPWFSRGALRALMRDTLIRLQALLHRRRPDRESGEMASAVHGLGLLTATGMAATGTAYFILRGSPLASTVLDLHGALANLMWIYLFGHAGVATLHSLFGSNILGGMFGFGAASSRGTGARQAAYATARKRDR